MGQPMVDGFYCGRSGTNFPYRSTAEAYRMIDTSMVPVIIGLDPEVQAAIAWLGVADVPSSLIARQVQAHTVQVPEKAREKLRQNGKGSFRAPDLRGDQFFVLEDNDLYHADTGLRWEDAEYLAADLSMI
jgi:CRISPR-associated endonuclease/helicase Cas3